MKQWLAIGGAGALGALARTCMSLWIPAASGFPIGTFVVNLAGTFILCFLVEKTRSWTLVNKTTFDAITVGFLGSFTTFSAFSYESILLLQSQLEMGIMYIVLSLFLGLFAGALGFRFGGRSETQ